MKKSIILSLFMFAASMASAQIVNGDPETNSDGTILSLAWFKAISEVMPPLIHQTLRML